MESRKVEGKISRLLGTVDCAKTGFGQRSRDHVCVSPERNRKPRYGDILLRMALRDAWTGDPTRVEGTRKVTLSRW